MRLNAPNKMLWIVAVVLGALGGISGLGVIHVPYAFYLLLIGFILLAVGTLIRI
ncbi:MAG: hypothetical protein R3200_12670 [Xanthomonadales bacterium]|nr:hypothetical protein [Xanthomonadales bacterium]